MALLDQLLNLIGDCQPPPPPRSYSPYVVTPPFLP